MFNSKRYANEVKSGKRVFAHHNAMECLAHQISAEVGSHKATEYCLDAMSALASLHRYATEYAVASQTAFETALEVEDGVGSQEVADADADRAAEAKEAYEKALARFNGAIGRLTPEG